MQGSCQAISSYRLGQAEVLACRQDTQHAGQVEQKTEAAQEGKICEQDTAEDAEQDDFWVVKHLAGKILMFHAFYLCSLQCKNIIDMAKLMIKNTHILGSQGCNK